MAVVDNAFISMPFQFSNKLYEVLRDLEVECVMCDWNINLDQKQVGSGSTWGGTNYLYIDLKKNELVWYQIERVVGDFNLYTVWNIHRRDTEYEGGILECIDYFRINLL